MAQLATIESLPSLQRDGYARHYSTLAEYYEAADEGMDNAAREQIDAGREPYLIDEDAADMGIYPLITVDDVLEKQDGLIGVVSAGRDLFLSPNTLLAWRA
jgi:hypothetical protein